MKLLLISILLSLSFSSIFAKEEGDGWSSSGGGEYIVTRNNPWFMGDNTVNWCINYGGEENFSLSLKQAKKDIKASIEQLSSQVRDLNNGHASRTSTDAGYPIEFESHCPILRRNIHGFENWESRCDDFSGDHSLDKKLNHRYKFVKDCANAELEFILGNTADKKIKKLIKDMGEKQFTKNAGLAIRTDYSPKTLKGKGFIYIAADKGPLQYSGERNKRFLSPTIWNYVSNLDPKTKFPLKLYVHGYEAEDLAHYNFKDHVTGPLTVVVAHELGHTFGFGHNNKGDLMDEDTPSKVITQGLMSNGEYYNSSQIFSKAFVRTGGPVQFVHSVDYNFLENRALDLSDSLYNLLFDGGRANSVVGPPAVDYIEVNLDDKKSSITFYKINKKKNKLIKNHEYLITLDIDNVVFQKIDILTFRYLGKTWNKALVYKPESGTWIEEVAELINESRTLNLIYLLNNQIPGTITLNSGKVLKIRIDLNYFEKSQFTIVDKKNASTEVSLILDKNIHFGYGKKESVQIKLNFRPIFGYRDVI